MRTAAAVLVVTLSFSLMLAVVVYGQGEEPTRVVIQLKDKPVLEVYRETLSATGDPVQALTAALTQLQSIRSAQASLTARLTDPQIGATIVRAEYLTQNEITITVEPAQVDVIRGFPEVQTVTVMEMTEYQATMGELTGQPVPQPTSDYYEFPAPGGPPGRP
jgi:hypothetical protein